MCGRFALSFISPVKLQQHFGLDQAQDLPVSYNIAPSQTIAAIREIDHHRFLSMLHWGLIPHWAKDATIGRKMINARCETVDEKPSFRQAIRSRRCIVLASGFYEWAVTPRGKTPHYITLRDDNPLALAGLWETWTTPEGAKIESCAILTTGANTLMTAIHDRMPVILHPYEFDNWLDPTVIDPRDLRRHYEPYPSELMQAWPVSPSVNSPTHNSPDCIIEVSP